MDAEQAQNLIRTLMPRGRSMSLRSFGNDRWIVSVMVEGANAESLGALLRIVEENRLEAVVKSDWLDIT